ncbi:MAG: hypothetical protein ACR2O4_12270 [Hyphomicrobiaceae bacterium]
MARIAGIVGAILLTVVLLYLSRFWIWQAPWDTGGLFGIGALAPGGDVLRRLFRGTTLGAFDLVIWTGLVFGGLSALQWLRDRLSK